MPFLNPSVASDRPSERSELTPEAMLKDLSIVEYPGNHQIAHRIDLEDNHVPGLTPGPAGHILCARVEVIDAVAGTDVINASNAYSSRFSQQVVERLLEKTLIPGSRIWTEIPGAASKHLVDVAACRTRNAQSRQDAARVLSVSASPRRSKKSEP